MEKPENLRNSNEAKTNTAFERTIQRYIVVAFSLVLFLGNTGCNREDATDDYDTTTTTDAQKSIEETETMGASGPCALTNEEVNGVINDSVTETFAEGNWGIASTCTYATAASPVAVELSSVMSTDLSSDRAFEGAQDVPDLGDGAVWIPITSRLTVIDKSKNKLLRIGVGIEVTEKERLEIAKAIARLALPKL